MAAERTTHPGKIRPAQPGRELRGSGEAVMTGIGR